MKNFHEADCMVECILKFVYKQTSLNLVCVGLLYCVLLMLLHSYGYPNENKIGSVILPYVDLIWII